jgi:hypothetical protein
MNFKGAQRGDFPFPKARMDSVVSLLIKSAAIILALAFCASCTKSPPSGAPDSSTGLPSESTIKKLKSGYDQAIQSRIDRTLHPGEFNRMFPGSDNGISYYTGLVGPSSWTSQIGLHDRYVFKMNHPIEMNSAKTAIVATGEPTFYLYELTKIALKPNGTFGVTINQMRTFSAHDWRRLVAAKGDFGVLGIVLNTNNPVANFEAAWRKF